MIVVVTGGAGFIGTHLTRKLCLDNRVSLVRVIDLERCNSEVFSHDKVSFFQADLSAQSALDSVLRGVNTVFHLASQLRPGENAEAQTAVERERRSTSVLLQAASLNAVRRVILASSAAVYGEQDVYPVAESAPVNPLSAYGCAKLALEHSAERHSRETGLPIVVLRLFNVYGEDLRVCRATSMFLHKVFEAISSNKLLSITGQGKQTRDFVHVDDAVAALCAAAFDLNERYTERVYNVGTGAELSVLETVLMLEDLAGLIVAKNFIDADAREPLRSVADVTASREILGFSAKIALREGLERVWNAMRAQGVSSPQDRRLCS